MVQDASYRQRQRKALQDWRKNKPQYLYQRKYRENNPEYVRKNRAQQSERNRRKRCRSTAWEGWQASTENAADKATVEAIALQLILIGFSLLSVATGEPVEKIVKMDAFAPEHVVSQHVTANIRPSGP